jgi:hypothetical protein
MAENDLKIPNIRLRAFAPSGLCHRFYSPNSLSMAPGAKPAEIKKGPET